MAPSVRAAFPLAALCAAAFLARAHPAAAQHAHHDRPPPAAPADARAEGPVRAEFAAGPVGAPGTRAPLQREELELRLRLTDAAGRPLTGLSPRAWVDVRNGAAATSPERCRQRVGAFVEAGMHVKHGQINLTQPVDDLNGHYVVALARGGMVAVLDPVKGFGQTRMLTAVRLGAEPADWAASADDRRLFVTLPDRGEIAVVGTHAWRVERRVRVGTRPVRIRADGAGRLWVSDEGRGVAVLAADGATVAGRLDTGAGPHAIAFSHDGARAFVADRAAGTLTVVDAGTLRTIATVPAGRAPADVAWSAARGAAFVVDEAGGTLTAVDGEGAVHERVPLAPGVRSVRFAPEAGHGHAGHGGDAPTGPHAFVLNPSAGTLTIYDARAREVIRTLSGAPAPDQVAFTGGFAYVRAAGTPSVALIPLADPRAGAVGTHDYFPAGGRAPGPVSAAAPGDLVVPQPGMHDAVYAANPAERMIYSYHYMEGMPIPHGGLTTYAFTPIAVRVVSRRVRETEPGVYTASLRLDRPGEYDLVVRASHPPYVACHAFTVAADPSLGGAGAVRVALEPAVLRPGPAALRFRLSAPGGGPLEEVDDVTVLLAGTDGWQRRARAVPLGGGLYRADFDVPAAGTYLASFRIPSRGVALGDLSPAAVRVAP